MQKALPDEAPVAIEPKVDGVAVSPLLKDLRMKTRGAERLVTLRKISGRSVLPRDSKAPDLGAGRVFMDKRGLAKLNATTGPGSHFLQSTKCRGWIAKQLDPSCGYDVRSASFFMEPVVRCGAGKHSQLPTTEKPGCR